jgi:hypothetical protein
MSSSSSAPKLEPAVINRSACRSIISFAACVPETELRELGPRQLGELADLEIIPLRLLAQPPISQRRCHLVDGTARALHFGECRRPRLRARGLQQRPPRSRPRRPPPRGCWILYGGCRSIWNHSPQPSKVPPPRRPRETHACSAYLPVRVARLVRLDRAASVGTGSCDRNGRNRGIRLALLRSDPR